MTKLNKKLTTRIVDTSFPIVLWIIALVYIFPLFVVVLEAFKTRTQIVSDPFGLPTTLNIDNFKKAFVAINYLRSAFNSILITGCSVLIIVLLSSTCAYAISRRNNKFYNTIYMVFLAALIIPFQMTMLPLYELMKDFSLVNTYHGLILVYVSTGIVFPIFLLTGFIKSVPVELEESARIDGCGLYGTFFKIVFPLLKPSVATVAVLSTFSVWNDFMMPLLFVSKKDMKTLVVKIYDFMGQYFSEWDMVFASILLIVFPIILVYLFSQRYIINGITAGAVKG